MKKKRQYKNRKKHAYGTPVTNYMETPGTELTENDINIAKAQHAGATNPLAQGLGVAGGFISANAGMIGGAMGGAGMEMPEISDEYTQKDPSLEMDSMGNGQGTQVDPALAQQVFQFAFGGKVPVEVDGGEVAETPNGELMEFQGPDHEQGGVDVNLPEGTDIYSKRLRVKGKTLAQRKKIRESRIARVQKQLDANPTDAILKKTHERISASNETEEASDQALQEQANAEMEAQGQKFPNGTNPGGVPNLNYGDEFEGGNPNANYNKRWLDDSKTTVTTEDTIVDYAGGSDTGKLIGSTVGETKLKVDDEGNASYVPRTFKEEDRGINTTANLNNDVDVKFDGSIEDHEKMLKKLNRANFGGSHGFRGKNWQSQVTQNEGESLEDATARYKADNKFFEAGRNREVEYDLSGGNSSKTVNYTKDKKAFGGPVEGEPTETYEGADNYGEYQTWNTQNEAYNTNAAEHSRLTTSGYSDATNISADQLPKGKGFDGASGNYTRYKTGEATPTGSDYYSDAESGYSYIPQVAKPEGAYNVVENPEVTATNKANADWATANTDAGVTGYTKTRYSKGGGDWGEEYTKAKEDQPTNVNYVSAADMSPEMRAQIIGGAPQIKAYGGAVKKYAGGTNPEGVDPNEIGFNPIAEFLKANPNATQEDIAKLNSPAYEGIPTAPLSNELAVQNTPGTKGSVEDIIGTKGSNPELTPKQNKAKDAFLKAMEGSPSGAEALGLAGIAYSGVKPMLNTMSNRASDSANVNEFRDFGQDALASIDAQKQYTAQTEARKMQDLESQRLSALKRGRNSARSVNTQRALDLSSTQSANKAAGQIMSQSASEMQKILGQEAQAQNMQDKFVMQGEQNRDKADRQDKDNYNTQLSVNQVGAGRAAQELSKNLGKIASNDYETNLVNSRSPNFMIDKKGNVTDKKGNKLNATQREEYAAELQGLQNEKSGENDVKYQEWLKNNNI